MSAAGVTQDAFVSRAKPRREARVCERRRRPTLCNRALGFCKEGARTARRRAIAHAADGGAFHAPAGLPEAA
jgi:hypothetical protein